MPDDRTITYPADAVQRIADRLCDIDWNLPQDEASDYALDIVLDVTEAVDKLRAKEQANVAAVAKQMADTLRGVLMAVDDEPKAQPFGDECSCRDDHASWCDRG